MSTASHMLQNSYTTPFIETSFLSDFLLSTLTHHLLVVHERSRTLLFVHDNSYQISSFASHLFASSRDSTGLSNGACNAMEDDRSSNPSSKQSPLTIWPAPAIVAYVRPPPLRTKPETSPLATDHTLSGLLRNSSCRLHSRASVMRSFPIYEPSLSGLSLLLKSLQGKSPPSCRCSPLHPHR